MISRLPARLSIACFCIWACCAAAAELERTGGPYVPTPKKVVESMLSMANVGPRDFVVDLGSGDGVIVLTAASQLKASGLGVDIDPALVERSNAEAARLGVSERAKFQVQDVFKADLSRATVITLYLLPSMMINLRSKILIEPRPGTRVVSHDYNFGDWMPDDNVVLDVPEKEPINGIPRATLYLWVVPAKVQGTWDVQIDGGDRYALALKQQYQNIEGTANAAGARNVYMSYASLSGADVHFTLIDGSARRAFTGRVDGDSMQGTVELAGRRLARWSARRR